VIGRAYDIGAGVEANLLEAAFRLSLSATENEIARAYLPKFIDPRLSQDQRIALAARVREATG
jgi:hypothetical protein